MRVWTTLGIEPTGDPGAVRRAFHEKQGEAEEKPERVEELRRAYETALLWATAGLRPDALDEPDGDGLKQTLESIQSERGERPTSSEVVRAFWQVDTFAPEHRDGARVLHDELAALATSIDRKASPPEQAALLSEMLERSELEAEALESELDLVLPLVIAGSQSLEAIDQVVTRFRWRRSKGHRNEFHRMLVGEIVVNLNGISVLVGLRASAQGWWLLLPNEALAAEVLTGPYRPKLFLYASTFSRVWDHMCHTWNTLMEVPEPMLRELIPSETLEYWSRRLTQAPDRVVDMAQSLRVPLLGVTLLLALGVVAAIVGPRSAYDASTYLWVFVTPVVGWVMIVAVQFVFFWVVLLAHRVFVGDDVLTEAAAPPERE